MSNSYPIHCVATIVKNTAITKIIVEVEKYVANVHNKILTTILTIATIRISVRIAEAYHPVHARSCESWKLEKEILGIKHKNNIPFNEARKMIVGSKTTTYSQAVQRNKTQYNYERIVKK